MNYLTKHHWKIPIAKTHLWLFLLICFLPAKYGFSQVNTNTYEGLVSEGTMPQVLRNILSLDGKKEEDVFLKRLCQSGKIVYGSTLNRYLDKILDNLLVKHPQLRSEISIFVVKSPEVNAFAMTRGIIFVNIGFLAQVTNEAEIAFVLAHEIVHIAEKHSIELTKVKDLNSYLSYHNRSREKENEADKFALERYYAASNYSYKAISGAFDVLQYGYLPFDEIPFKRSMVESDFYKFDDKYFLKNVKSIHSREDYIDTLSTHPNLLKRRTSADNFAASKDDNGRELFPQGEELFEIMQTIARLECIRQYLTQHQYGKAYYNAYVLSQSMPENVFFQNAMAIAVYGLSKHKHDGSLRDVLSKHTEIEGEMQQIYFFFAELTRKELSVLAVRLLWQAHKRSPENANIKRMNADAMKDMIVENNLYLDQFSDYPMGAEIVEDTSFTVNEDTISSTSQSKYERIKGTQTQKKVKPSEKFTLVNYMLVDLKQDPVFVQFIQQVKKDIEDEEILAVIASDNAWKGVGSEGILLLDPAYQVVRKGEISFEKSLKGKEKLTKTLTNSSKTLRLNTQNMQDAEVKHFKTEEYNDYCQLKDWLTDVAQIKKNMVFYQNEGVTTLAENLNSKYLVLTSVGVKPGKFMTYNKFQTLALSALCPVVFPAYLGRFMAPRQVSSTSFVAIELETGKVVYSKRQTTESASNQTGLINAFVYDCLYKLKNGEKSNVKKK